MELNSKKLERTSKLIYYAISVILCLFLILLSNKIIDDLDTATQKPEVYNFENKALLKTLDNKMNGLNIDIENLYINKKNIEKTIANAKENYFNQKQSFDNWVQTRKTLGKANNDNEVTSRVKKLDDFYKIEQNWRTQLSANQTQIEAKQKLQTVNQQWVDKEKEQAYKKYEVALEKYDLKVFAIRLLFVAPILALGIFFFMRYRRHKFWPLFFGFTLFSVYAFFFGLVPYLPSYGGYIRYGLGIILSAGLGYYAIKTIRQYLDKKQAELKTSTQERAQNVAIAVAEKAFENHFCPSCGKDFMLKKWEAPLKITETAVYKLVTNFCRHCGLQLFTNCNKCGNSNFAHLPFCATCGCNLSQTNNISL